jgi:hypothetical protein
MAFAKWNLSRSHNPAFRLHARSRKGQGQLEYGLILSLVGLACFGSLITASHEVNGLYERATVKVLTADQVSSSPSFSQFADLNFERARNVTQGEDGSLSFNGPYSGVELSGSLPTNGVPTSISLQISGGPPPAFVRVSDETTGGTTYAWYSGTTDASGNPTYTFQDEVWGDPATTFHQGDTFSLGILRGNVEGTTVLTGYTMNQSPPPAT